ncbi:hypothetical protein [Candidatus Nitrosocosmicus sp. T]
MIICFIEKALDTNYSFKYYINPNSKNGYSISSFNRANYSDNEAFFIDANKERKNELEKHRNILKNDLLSINQSFNFIPTEGNGIPLWLSTIRINPTIGFVPTDFVQYHLERDNPQLLNHIPKFIEEIESHNQKVLEFMNNSQLFIENDVRRMGIEVSIFPNQGFYYNEDYRTFLNLQLDRITTVLRNGLEEISLSENLTLLQNDFNSRYHLSRNGNGYLLLGNFLVGRNNELITHGLEEILVNIPFRTEILMEITNLYTNRLYLQNKLDLIVSELGDVVQKIDRLQYRTKVKCCPRFSLT